MNITGMQTINFGRNFIKDLKDKHDAKNIIKSLGETLDEALHRPVSPNLSKLKYITSEDECYINRLLNPGTHLSIKENKSRIKDWAKNSIQSGHPTKPVPKYVISINDWVRPCEGGHTSDCYVSDRVNITRNAAVNGNMKLDDPNKNGSTLVSIDYPVYSSEVTAKDVFKAIDKFRKLIEKTFKELK